MKMSIDQLWQEELEALENDGREFLPLPRATSREQVKEGLKTRRRAMILDRLLNGPEKVEEVKLDQLTTKAQLEALDEQLDRKKNLAELSLRGTPGTINTLVGLLTCSDVDSRGPDTPVDSFRRTAAHYFCDPEIWSKLNPSQMENLHSLDTLEDLVHSGCSWHLPDGFGRTPWELAPEWVREVLLATQHRLARIRAGEFWTAHEEQDNE